MLAFAVAAVTTVGVSSAQAAPHRARTFTTLLSASLSGQVNLTTFDYVLVGKQRGKPEFVQGSVRSVGNLLSGAGLVTITNEDGDTETLVHTADLPATGIVFGSDLPFPFKVVYTIIGGTGDLAGATGSDHVEGCVGFSAGTSPDTFTETVKATVRGTITLPDDGDS